MPMLWISVSSSENSFELRGEVSCILAHEKPNHTRIIITNRSHRIEVFSGYRILLQNDYGSPLRLETDFREQSKNGLNLRFGFVMMMSSKISKFLIDTLSLYTIV